MLAESFFAATQTGVARSNSWPTRAAAAPQIFDFFEGWYNSHRLYSSLNYAVPPNTRPNSQTTTPTVSVKAEQALSFYSRRREGEASVSPFSNDPPG